MTARPKVSVVRLMRVRLEVHTRDNFACRMCGWQVPRIPVDYDGRYALGDDRYVKPNGKPGCRILELDHVLPFSLGGKFELANLQTLCNLCNASKGARV